VVGVGEAGVRLDRYLARHLPVGVSRAMIQRGIRDRGILIGTRTVKAHYKVRAGDVVAARFPRLPARSRDLDVAAQELPLDIVYEDEHLLVVNKPAGMVTHPAPGHWDATLVNAILWHLKRAQGSRLTRAGIIHRLDKDTSGLLLVAKTEAAHA
jgi:23S rRNA pseudouridine1911/1915/1917 synthase